MKLSISNIAWDVKDDEEVARILQGLDIDRIDIAPGKYIRSFSDVDLHECHAVRKWWLDRGVGFAGMQSLLFGTEGLNLFGSHDVQQRMLKHLASVCRIGDALDARSLVFGSPKNRDRSALSDQDAHDSACDFFSRLADVAQTYAVVICLEPNPTAYGANFMTTTPEAAQIVDAVNHPCIKLQLDTGSMCMNNEDPDLICSQYQQIIGHVHASEPMLMPVGTDACNHQACATAISMYLPDSTVTIEMLTNSSPAPLEAIAASIRFSLKHYHDPGQVSRDLEVGYKS